MCPFDDRTPNDDAPDDPVVPDRLATFIRSRAMDAPTFPASASESMQAASRRHFNALQRRRRWIVGGPLLAAAVLLMVLLVQPWASVQRATTSQQNNAQAASKPTIHDAFALARRLATDAETTERWDHNDDGRVDHADVDALAMAAVRLEGGA